MSTAKTLGIPDRVTVTVQYLAECLYKTVGECTGARNFHAPFCNPNHRNPLFDLFGISWNPCGLHAVLTLLCPLEVPSRCSGCPSSSNLRDLHAGNYSLHSPRPLLWLYRHATRQGRRCIPPKASKVHEALAKLSESSKPLVIDLGCGFGASSLGLAQHGQHAVLAVDASAHCINYATALSRRWQLHDVAFVQCAAEEALAAASGMKVEWMLINFPTPFAVQSNRTGLSCSFQLACSLFCCCCASLLDICKMPAG